LFYIRKDTLTKKISHLLPSLKDVFPGKPVTVEQGEGYVIGKKPGTDRVFYLKVKD
jgi:hypothetical protein